MRIWQVDGVYWLGAIFGCRIVGCHGAVPLLGHAIVGCHCWLPSGVIVVGGVLLLDAMVAWWGAIVGGCWWVVIAGCHVGLPCVDAMVGGIGWGDIAEPILRCRC